ncbi:alpha-N-arabinofuranosidase [Amnibacterium kyonggiense]|uniref:non-reducing end alpha-L-arabinofuranosidase n=1 Tax=Amnibacterium kyonggiense TaxID=595671 RepID=A0A4R7FQT5_9MICO|nr:alpha-N-arabinofuranosidase [Amnibacterium kyonggiense]TDS80123.1 alpha-N-arabinofuranosidase [Amnibacterium kyonggiense]
MPEARITVSTAAPVGSIDRRVFGSFVEHLGRCVYDGIHEPGHPSADEQGFREDVLELVRELGVTTVRYPGGNFVSGYRWEDGVGPKDRRPVRRDLAWHSTETNQVGLHEFAHWNTKAGSEPMLAINLGTRDELAALDLLEYTNLPVGSTLSDERAANGATDGFGVKMWCLGNEMDGPWQLGHRSAEDYGKLASRTAKALRQLQPDLDLVVCGSSGRGMPTFGSWERVVLEHTYEDVDFISAHAYYEPHDGDVDSFLASAVDMDRFIEAVAATADAVKAELRHDKTIFISFDEWNVWYQSRYHDTDKVEGLDNWPIAPRLLEDVYTVTDAVVFGSLMISLLKHADRVKAASLAQLVNVIAPIMTEPGGPAWRQTTFFPFAITARLAQGEALQVGIDAPTITTKAYGDVPAVDAVVTRGDAGAGVFLVNRHRTEPITVTVDLEGLRTASISETHLIADDDPDAANTLEDQERVRPTPNDTAAIQDGVLTVTLPPVSWTAIGLTA